MQVWHVMSLYHPAVIERGAPWDSAFIRAATVVRSANDPQQLAVAYRRLLSVLQDPLTRVELADAITTSGAPEHVVFGAERTSDSVLIVRVPLGSAQRALWTDSAAAMVRQQLATAPARVILDVRGSGATLDSLDAAVERFVANAALVTSLNSVLTTASTERTRRVGGARAINGQWQPDDAWTVRTGRPVFAGATQPRRVMVLANRATVLPRALLSLVALAPLQHNGSQPLPAQQPDAVTGPEQMLDDEEFINPFATMAAEAAPMPDADMAARVARARARAERLQQLPVDRIADDQIPPGMRRVRTPFGDRLVPVTE